MPTDPTPQSSPPTPEGEVKSVAEHFQRRILDLCAKRGTIRDTIAPLYAACIYGNKQHFGIADWKAVNAAIIAKWSQSGLTYIKTKAWAMKGDAMPMWVTTEANAVWKKLQESPNAN